MKKIILPLLMGAATVAVAAPDYRTLPIEQREAVPSNLDYPQAVQTQGAPQAPALGAPANNTRALSAPATAQSARPSIAAPVQSVQQPAVPSNVQWELYNQLQQLQQELAQLRGLVEQQGYELSQLKDQQR